MEESKSYSKGYGKRPIWQWILIYLLVGGVIYFLVYYFVFAKNGSYNSGSSTPQENSQPSGGY